MSARDSAGPAGPGNTSAGGLGNGGVGGGFGGGSYGGGNGGGNYGNGGGVNGGYNNQTGLSTGKDIYGNTAFGNSGQMATGYAMRDPMSMMMAGMGPTSGSYRQFNNLDGTPMFNGSLGNQSFTGMSAGQAYNAAAAQAAAQAAAARAHPSVPGILSGPLAPIHRTPPTAYPPAIDFLPQWPGTGMWWGNSPPWNNDASTWPGVQRPSDYHIGRQNIANGGYKDWTGDAHPPGFGGQYSAFGKGNNLSSQPSSADGKGNFGGPQPSVSGGKGDFSGPNFNGNKGYY